jgi:hypothetical protein
MRTRLIFLVLLIVCFSCTTNNKPVSDAQKEKIKGEIKEVNSAMLKALEEADFNKAIEPYYNSPDFVFTNNENSFDYKQFVNAVKQNFSTLLNQKITINEEKHVFLDKSTVIYTAKGKCLANYKDGHAILSEPLITQFTFEKNNDKWEAINLVQISVNKPIKNTETSKELNQIELHKQFVGTWKGEVAKDTTWVYENKSYGTGFECFIKYITKRKVIGESKRLCGYDENLDKYFYAYVEKGGYSGLMAEWFTSNNKVEVVKYSDISNPDKASWKVEAEIKSPDMYTETLFIDKKSVWSATFTRIK